MKDGKIVERKHRRNKEDYLEFCDEHGTHYLTVGEVYKSDFKKPKWRGIGLSVDGVYFKINELRTDYLIRHMRELQEKPRKTNADNQRIKYLGWVIRWRNTNPDKLPIECRYEPQVLTSLEDLNEFNLPEGLYELSLQYKLALRFGTKGQILMLHNELHRRGYIYRPGEYVDEEFHHERLEIAGTRFSEEDRAYLRTRGLYM